LFTKFFEERRIISSNRIKLESISLLCRLHKKAGPFKKYEGIENISTKWSSFFGRIVSNKRRQHLAFHDLVDEGRQVGAFEGFLETSHLVDDAPQRPDVRLLVIDLTLAHLRAVGQFRQTLKIDLKSWAVFYILPVKRSSFFYNNFFAEMDTWCSRACQGRNEHPRPALSASWRSRSPRFWWGHLLTGKR